MTKQEEIRGLTIQDIEQAIALLPPQYDIGGYKVHPADLEYLAEQVNVAYSESTRYILPSYAGLSLYPDISIPRGYAEPVRRKHD